MPLLILLASCATGSSGGSHSDSCRLLPLVEYPQDRALVIVSQIEQAPPELQRFALDAVELRDAVRACRG